MRDERINKWADIIVNYSLNAQPKKYCFILADTQALSLAEACLQKLLQAGSFVECFLCPPFSEINFKYATNSQLSFTPPLHHFAMQKCDLFLTIGGGENTKLLANIDPHKQTLSSQGKKPIIETMMKRYSKGELRWCYTHFPTPSLAQDSDMGTLEFEEFVFNAGFLNEKNPIQKWEELEAKQQNLINFLKTKKELHFQNAQGTDLLVNIEKMKWINCSGKINFPDGEIYTGPNLQAKDGGVNGIARYSIPTVYRQTEVCDIELTFEKGKVTTAKASKNEQFLQEMINQDQGAKFVGEIAIGTNYQIQKCTKNILFDEKIGGTFHLALGHGYPQTGNNNQSALHWDMIFELKKGSISADGEIILENGKFKNPNWPLP